MKNNNFSLDFDGKLTKLRNIKIEDLNRKQKKQLFSFCEELDSEIYPESTEIINGKYKTLLIFGKIVKKMKRKKKSKENLEKAEKVLKLVCEGVFSSFSSKTPKTDIEENKTKKREFSNLRGSDVIPESISNKEMSPKQHRAYTNYLGLQIAKRKEAEGKTMSISEKKALRKKEKIEKNYQKIIKEIFSKEYGTYSNSTYENIFYSEFRILANENPEEFYKKTKNSKIINEYWDKLEGKEKINYLDFYMYYLENNRVRKLEQEIKPKKEPEHPDRKFIEEKTGISQQTLGSLDKVLLLKIETVNTEGKKQKEVLKRLGISPNRFDFEANVEDFEETEEKKPKTKEEFEKSLEKEITLILTNRQLLIDFESMKKTAEEIGITKSELKIILNTIIDTEILKDATNNKLVISKFNIARMILSGFEFDGSSLKLPINRVKSELKRLKETANYEQAARLAMEYGFKEEIPDLLVPLFLQKVSETENEGYILSVINILSYEFKISDKKLLESIKNSETTKQRIKETLEILEETKKLVNEFKTITKEIKTEEEEKRKEWLIKKLEKNSNDLENRRDFLVIFSKDEKMYNDLEYWISETSYTIGYLSNSIRQAKKYGQHSIIHKSIQREFIIQINNIYIERINLPKLIEIVKLLSRRYQISEREIASFVSPIVKEKLKSIHINFHPILNDKNKLTNFDGILELYSYFNLGEELKEAQKNLILEALKEKTFHLNFLTIALQAQDWGFEKLRNEALQKLFEERFSEKNLSLSKILIEKVDINKVFDLDKIADIMMMRKESLKQILKPNIEKVINNFISEKDPLFFEKKSKFFIEYCNYFELDPKYKEKIDEINKNLKLKQVKKMFEQEVLMRNIFLNHINIGEKIKLLKQEYGLEEDDIKKAILPQVKEFLESQLKGSGFKITMFSIHEYEKLIKISKYFDLPEENVFIKKYVLQLINFGSYREARRIAKENNMQEELIILEQLKKFDEKFEVF
ncbi:MAG: hypothetical protein WC356_05635 [Candidatus Micrarchaeia archaeon]|jgi:hypothetical protein